MQEKGDNIMAVDQEFAAEPSVASKNEHKKTSAMERTSEWLFSQEIPSDITVQIGEVTFSMHKSALLSKCGYIRKLVPESSDSVSSPIELSDIPGGVEGFELAAMYCYGANFEINTENIAMLRCAAEYLGMTEACSDGNLVSRTEAYLEEVILNSLTSAVTVLHKSEDLLPMSERVKLVSRCIDAIAYLACNDNQFYLSPRTDNGSHESLSSSSESQPKAIEDWWAEELTVLRTETFQRVLIAMKARGLKHYALGPIIMLYAQKSLRGLDIFGRGRSKIEFKQEHEKRLVVETVVGLLPRERNAMSVSFLSMLLRAALFLETTVACRLDLIKRIGSQLEQAVLDDLLIPSFSSAEDAVYDVDMVQRILVNYLDNELDWNRSDAEYVSPPPDSLERVGRLMEGYLAEIASDKNLPISSFIGLAELIPEQARNTDDGMYRAIDIYLKAHPSLSDMQRKRVCSLMDCQKLSREACAHAAQNSRLPVQTVVQVLYHEQQRLRDSTCVGFTGGDSPSPTRKLTPHRSPSLPRKTAPQEVGHINNSGDELARLRRENGDLKLELVRLRMQLKELQKPSESLTSSGKPPLPRKSLINSVSRKLSRLNLFGRPDVIKPLSGNVRTMPPKDRRHSIS